MGKILSLTLLSLAVFNASAEQAESLQQAQTSATSMKASEVIRTRDLNQDVVVARDTLIMKTEKVSTKELVRAARLDDLVILGIPSVLFPRAVPTDPQFLKATECIAAEKNPGFAELLANAVEKTMSSEELESGDLFFNSITGRKYAELMVWQARNELAYKQMSLRPKFSRFEEEKVTKFLMSPAGRKLTTRYLFPTSQTAFILLNLARAL